MKRPLHNKVEAPKKEANGLTCHMLLNYADVRGDNLAVTWVDVEPGTRHLFPDPGDP